MKSSLEEYQFRPIKPQDLEQIMQLHHAQAFETGAPIPTMEAVQGMLIALAEQLPFTSRLAITPDEKIAGFMLLIPSQGPDSEIVHVEAGFQASDLHTELPDQFMDWAAQGLRDLAKQRDYSGPIRLIASFNDLRQDLLKLYTAFGFERFITQIRMLRHLSLPIPKHSFPEGVSLRAYQDQDSEAMRLVFNDGFKGHWIGELPVVTWRQRFIDTERFRPDLTYLAWQRDQLVGFYLSENHPEQPTQGWLEVMAVGQAFRRRGIGTALVNHALERYRTMGFSTAGLDVDLENITNAKSLYERAGFEKVQGTCYYTKTI